jgi:hypothetical protein
MQASGHLGYFHRHLIAACRCVVTEVFHPPSSSSCLLGRGHPCVVCDATGGCLRLADDDGPDWELIGI